MAKEIAREQIVLAEGLHDKGRKGSAPSLTIPWYLPYKQLKTAVTLSQYG